MVVEALAGGPQTRAEREAEGLLQLTRARIEAREIDERERENTSAIVLLGRRLCTIQKQGYHKLEQERARFADWVDKNMPFQIRQARRYMAVAHLAPELVAGRTLSLTKLQIIAAAPAWARELLCQKCDSSTDAARMRRAVKAGLEHARRYECIPEAVLHIAAVLDGEPALRAEKRLDDPEALGDEAISLLQRLLTSLQKLAKLGLPLTGKWVQQLVHIEGLTHAELELLMGSLRQQKPRSESEILEAAAAASETAAAREAARCAAQRAGVAEVIDDLSAAMARPVSRATAAPAPVSRATAAPTPPVSRVTAAPTAEAAPSPVTAPPAPVSRVTAAPTAEAAPTPGAEPTAAAAPPAEESPAEESPAEASPAEESPAEESPAPAAAPASVEWADLCAAIRGVLSPSEQFELTLGLVAQVCECNAASRERGQRAIRRLNDFAEEVEGPGKLPAGTINSLVRQLLAESLHARFWLATQLLGESRLPSALLYLHSIRGMVPLAYRLHLEDMCKLYPMSPPVSDQDPEAYDAWVAKLHQDALDAKALVIARRKAEEAARRKEQGW